MRFKVFIITLFVYFIVCFKVMAQFMAQSYQLVGANEFPAMAIYEISQKLAPYGFYEVDLKRKGQIFKTPIDQLYLHSSLKDAKAILILDLVLNTHNRMLQLSETEFVCHAQTSRGRFFSLYINTNLKKDFDSLCNSFSVNKFSSSKFFQFYHLMVQTSHAQTTNTNCTTLQKPKNDLTDLTDLTKLKSSLDDSTVIQGLGTCLAEVLRGSTETFSGIKDSLVSLFKNPKELWKEVSTQATALKNFLVHIKDEVVQLKTSLGNLDSELILQLGCHLGGQVLTSLGLAALTGAGIVKLSSTLAQAVLKLKSIQSLLTRLTQIKKVGNTQLAKEVLTCVSSN